MKKLKASPEEGKDDGMVAGYTTTKLAEWYKHNKQTTIGLVAAAILVLGVVAPLIYHSIAASGSVAFEPENGTASSVITKGTDTNASGGNYIQFGGSPTSGSALTVNANTVVSNFDARMKGISMGNWTFNFGNPYIGQYTNLKQAMQAINPGIIRYAGGLKANWIGFDRNQKTPLFDTTWTFNGQSYEERYGTDELASLNSFAAGLNAKVMIQVNVSNNDPSMWADLVRYAKEQNWTSFKHYEFSNELDLLTANGDSMAITPAVYGSRVAAYETAMLAVDPTISFMGGVPAAGTDIIRNNWGSGGDIPSQYITQSVLTSHNAGHDLGAIAFHWYQNNETSAVADTFRWTWGIDSTSTDFWRQSYSRQWSEQIGPFLRSKALSGFPNTEIGISELGEDSGTSVNNGNHVAALWYSDVLGRLAYNGINWATNWDSFAGQDEWYSIMYPSSSSASATINVRPSYYAYLMYSKYFGDQMVKSSSYDQSKISIWASKDTSDPGKLKLRITNVTGSAITAPVNLTGFSASSGGAYTLSSTNPLDTSNNSPLSGAPESINGVKINGNNVASSLASITPTNVSASGSSFNYTVPAYSSVAIVLSGTFQ